MVEETVVETTETLEKKENLKTPAEVKSVASEQSDYEKILAEKDAKIAKLSSDNENYKKGIKKWQRLAKEEDSYVEQSPLENEELQSLIDQKVKEAISASQLAEAVKERDEFISKMAKENSELKVALKNRPGSPTGSGTNTEKPEVKTEFFTKEQLDELKARGVDPQKVIENYRKIKET